MKTNSEKSNKHHLLLAWDNYYVFYLLLSEKRIQVPLCSEEMQCSLKSSGFLYRRYYSNTSTQHSPLAFEQSLFQGDKYSEMKQKYSCTEEGFIELTLIVPILFSAPINKQNFPRYMSAQMLEVLNIGY